MNNNQVQKSLEEAKKLYGNNASYSALKTGDIIAYLQKNLGDISADLQLAFDCLVKFKCRGFHAEEKIGLQIDLSTSLGLEAHEDIMRALLAEYELAQRKK